MNKKEVLPIILIFGIIFTLGVLVLGAQNTTNNTNSTNINATINNINSTNLTTNNNTDASFENETNKVEIDNETEISNKAEIENETEIDNETEKEIQTIHAFQHGANVRILQLKRSLRIKIFEAQTVINYMKNNSIGNTTKLEILLSQLKALNESISNISTTNKTEAIKSFVDIKLQAKRIINEFRVEAGKYLNEENKKSLRALFVKIERDKLKELRNELIKEKRELLKEQAKKLLQRIGRNDTTIIQGIQNGTYSAEQIREILRKKYLKIKAANKSRIKEKLEEQEKEIQKERIEALKEAQKNLQERLKEAKKKRDERAHKYRGKENGTSD